MTSGMELFVYLGKIRSSEKLPRGSYFYIRVGDRLYAGESAVIQTTPVKTPPSYLTPSSKPDGSRRWRYGCGSITQIERRFRAHYEKREGRKVPEYWMEPEEKPDPVKKAVTGSEPRLTDDFKDVKQFRRLNQAEAACDKLNKLYAGLDIKVRIELHKGDR